MPPGSLLSSVQYSTLCNTMDCRPPGFSVHGIFQARILDWVVIFYSRGSSQPRGLRPPELLERPAGFPSSDKTRPDSPVPTLQGPCGRSPKRRGSLRFLPPHEVRPSSVAPDPAESRGAPPPTQDPSPLRGTLGSSLRSPAEGEASTFIYVYPLCLLHIDRGFSEIPMDHSL